VFGATLTGEKAYFAANNGIKIKLPDHSYHFQLI